MAKTKMMALQEKADFRDVLESGKVPLGKYQGASSREGETSQVLRMGLSRPGEGILSKGF